MIKSLNIEHYALIDQLSIDFHSGFSVITGETGAGKSIILGAIGLCKQECVLDLRHKVLICFFVIHIYFSIKN